jgi:hypothetical protein
MSKIFVCKIPPFQEGDPSTIEIAPSVPSKTTGYFDFLSMVEAVECAIASATKIRRDAELPADYDGEMIEVRFPIVLKHGGVPFGITGHDPYSLDDASLSGLRQWAIEWDEKLDRCDECGAIIGEEIWTEDNQSKFCSRHCLDQWTNTGSESEYEEF